MLLERRVVLPAFAVVLVLIVATFLVQRNEGQTNFASWVSSSPLGKGDTAGSSGESGSSIAELEQRIRVLEGIVFARNRGLGQGRQGDLNSDVAGRGAAQAGTQDVVTATLEAAMEQQAAFDAEAGMRSSKGAAAETNVSSALKSIVASEQRYAPIEPGHAECRKSMCRMKYRYSDPSTAEYASTMLLMELNQTFRKSDIMILPNEDGSYELLVFSHLR